MPWCPNCKNEYKDGITVCADCKIPLVEHLAEDNLVPLLTVDNEESAGRLADFLEYEGIEAVTLVEGEDGKVELQVPESDRKKAVKAAQAFLSVEQEKELGELPEEDLAALAEEKRAEQEAVKGAHTYVSAADQYKDNRSTAFTFIGFSILGLIFVGLNAAGIIGFLANWFSIGVAAALFAVFLLIGIGSFRRVGVLKSRIEEEAKQRRETVEWMESHFTPAVLNRVCDPEAGEEENDIARISYMKEALTEAFPKLEDNFADHLVDEFFTRMEEEHRY